MIHLYLNVEPPKWFVTNSKLTTCDRIEFEKKKRIFSWRNSRQQIKTNWKLTAYFCFAFRFSLSIRNKRSWTKFASKSLTTLNCRLGHCDVEMKEKIKEYFTVVIVNIYNHRVIAFLFAFDRTYFILSTFQFTFYRWKSGTKIEIETVKNGPDAVYFDQIYKRIQWTKVNHPVWVKCIRYLLHDH